MADNLVGIGVKFQRIRRITGYLVGTLDRFNNAKRQEESQRVEHGVGGVSVDFPRPVQPRVAPERKNEAA